VYITSMSMMTVSSSRAATVSVLGVQKFLIIEVGMCNTYKILVYLVTCNWSL